MSRSAPRPTQRASYRESLAFGGMTTVLMTVLGLVSSVVVARVVGVRIIGEFALASAPSAAVAVLGSASEQAGLVRRIARLAPRDPEATGLFAAVIGFSLALRTVVALVAVGVSSLVFSGSERFDGLFPAAVAMLVIGMTVLSLSFNVETVLASYRAGRELAVVRLGQVVAYLVAAIVIGLLWRSVWALVLATAISALLTLPPRLVYLHRYLKLRVPRSVLREGVRELPGVVRFGLRMTPAAIATGLSAQVGVWLLGATGSVVQVGAFSRALQFAVRFVDANARVTEVLLPTLVERTGEDDRAGHDRALIDSVRYFAVLMLLPAAVFGGASLGVLGLFGDGFGEASAALAWVMLLPAISAVTSVQAQALIGANRPGSLSLTAIGALVAVVGSSLLLVGPFGAAGVAAGLVLGSAVQVVWLQALVRPLLATPLGALWPLRQALAIPIAYAAGFVVARLVDRGVPGTVVGLVLAGIAGTAAYGAALVLCGGLGDRDRARVGELRARVAARRAGAAPA